MSKSKKPTGLSITRKDNKFTISWKIGAQDYGAGQNLRYRTKTKSGKWRKWVDVSVGNTTTSKVITLSKNSYYPNTDKYLMGIEFQIRGRRKSYTTGSGSKEVTHTPDWSEWSSKIMSLTAPAKPSLSASLGLSNVTTFSWSVPATESDAKPYFKYEYQSILVKECTEVDGSKLHWKTSARGYRSGNGTATSGSLPITEETETVERTSYTRWFRVRTKGPAGTSDWRYAKHVYAIPYAAVINKVKATPKPNKILVDVTWTATKNAAYPIDNTNVEYCIGVPSENMGLPSDPQWTGASTSKDTNGTDKSVFYIDDVLHDDQCLWVRVVTKHDTYENYSLPVRALVGSLKNPTNLTVTTSGQQATVSATNESDACEYTGSDPKVKRLFLAVYYRGAKYNTIGYIVGIIPTGTSSVNITLPNQTDETAYSIGVKAVVGTYIGNSITSTMMESETIWTTANVPEAPSESEWEYDGRNLLLSWSWDWEDADSVELSWSEDPEAWNSTNEPDTYVIDKKATSWTISELEAGKTYYIKIRLIDSSRSEEVYGPYCETIEAYLTAPPLKPDLVVSEGIITDQGKVTASWNYLSGDGSDQVYAEISVFDGTDIGEPIAHTESSQHITIYAAEQEWERGETYQLVLRVKSESGSFSEYSDPVSVEIAELLQAEITSDSFEIITVHDDTSETREVTALTEMPLLLSVAGAEEKGITSIAIERAEDYRLDRPDEEETTGYEEETVYLTSFMGEGSVTIDNDDLEGYFDDGAKYRLIVTVSDDLGQSTFDSIDFEVHWEHQALIPEGTVVIDGDIAKITPIEPTGALTGDYCDIYRLSADKPVLIYPNAIFGETYVDPYPAIGEYGGHRIVFRTKNGDYITDDNSFAWKDFGPDEGDTFITTESIIDFALDKVQLKYDLQLSSEWAKDFRLTKYLGGSIQGDWNVGVERNATINAVDLAINNKEAIQAMRRLAEYTGICHIRSTDGSSYSADVQVSEDLGYDTAGKVASFTLKISRVDPEDYDGMPLEVWEGMTE